MSYGIPDSFPEIWKNFLSVSYVLSSFGADYPGWHRDRKRYYAWVLPLSDARVRKRHRDVRQALSGLLVEPLKRSLHVTLFVCGFVTDFPVHSDDMATSKLLAQKRVLSKMAVPEVLLKVSGVNSFTSAPFLEVHSPGGLLSGIRACLLQINKEQRFAPYVPHVTVGLYGKQTPAIDVARRLEPFRDLPSLACLVSSLDLVSFNAQELEGELRLECRIRITG